MIIIKNLNNNGWGFISFIVFISIFMAAFFIGAYFISKQGLVRDNKTEAAEITADMKEIYKNYEKFVKKEAMKNYNNINDITYIDIRDLKLSSAITNECDGYVIIDDNNQEMMFSSYLHCGNYRTSGYNYKILEK